MLFNLLVFEATGVFGVWSGEISVPIHISVPAAVRVSHVLPLLALSVLPASGDFKQQIQCGRPNQHEFSTPLGGA